MSLFSLKNIPSWEVSIVASFRTFRPEKFQLLQVLEHSVLRSFNCCKFCPLICCLFSVVSLLLTFEPQHDKTNKMTVTVRPAKTRISLGIHPVWSETSLCAQWVAKDPSFLHADSEDWSDWADAQVDLSLHWMHIPFCWFYHEAAHFIFAITVFHFKRLYMQFSIPSMLSYSVCDVLICI